MPYLQGLEKRTVLGPQQRNEKKQANCDSGRLAIKSDKHFVVQISQSPGILKPTTQTQKADSFKSAPRFRKTTVCWTFRGYVRSSEFRLVWFTPIELVTLLYSIRRWLPAAAAQNVAGGRAGQFSVIVFDLAVYDGEVDAFGEPIGFREGGAVDDGGGIEDGDVGKVAGF